MPPGANGLSGPAYVRWKAAERWKRAVARLDASIPAPDVSGLGPCSACGTTDIAAHGWLGDPVHGTCVPCDKGRREAAESAEGAAARPVPRVVTAVPDTYRRERLGFSVEVIEDVKVGEKVTIRQESGQITLLHEVIQRRTACGRCSGRRGASRGSAASWRTRGTSPRSARRGRRRTDVRITPETTPEEMRRREPGWACRKTPLVSEGVPPAVHHRSRRGAWLARLA